MTGQELRALRLRLRLSQEELARDMGVHRNTIIRWESDRSPIGKAQAIALRAIAGLRPQPRRRRKRTG